MGKSKNSGKITIANIVAIVGIVMLLVFSFVGRSYQSGGELGWDIAISVGFTAFAALLLWFMIKAKGAENELKKWQIIEYATLAVYIVAVIPASLFLGINHFFVVTEHKSEIQGFAKKDLQKIDNLFDDYMEFENQAIVKTGQGMRNATSGGQLSDTSLDKFFDDNRIARTGESVRTFESIQKTKLIDGGKKLQESYRKKRSEILGVVDSWNIILIPSKASLIEELATSSEKELTKLSGDGKLPVITLNPESERYTAGANQSKTFSVEGGVQSFEFKKALQDVSGFSIFAVIVVLIIHLLILFNYIVAYRTSVLELGTGMEPDGGRIL